MSSNLNLIPEERTELFGDFNPDDYGAEAEQRWSGSEAWAESARRTSSYTKGGPDAFHRRGGRDQRPYGGGDARGRAGGQRTGHGSR
nr:TipAS antibiotic-recognition domain-containing protein [Nonomuraea cypriaca]